MSRAQGVLEQGTELMNECSEGLTGPAGSHSSVCCDVQGASGHPRLLDEVGFDGNFTQ